MSTSETNPTTSAEGGAARETVPRVVRICNPLPVEEEAPVEKETVRKLEDTLPPDELVGNDEDDEAESDTESITFESTTTCDGESCKRLYSILRGISITTREYLTGQLTQSEAFSRVKQKYGSFKSSKKSEGLFSFKNKLKHGSFIFLIYVFSFLFTLWICYQIVRSLLGKYHDIRVIFGLIYLVIFNPIFSVLTVFLQMGGNIDNASNDISVDSIQTMENALVPCITSINTFTKENVCNFHKHFDTENLCNASNGHGDSEGNEDVDMKRRTILESLSKFFEKQNAFVLKSMNTSIGIKSNKSLDSCLLFLTGHDVEKTLSENVAKNNNTVLFNTSSSIRKTISTSLRQIEGEKYDKNPVESYERDFVEFLNRDLVLFVDEVIDLIRMDSTTYYTENNKIRSKPPIESLLSTTLYKRSALSVRGQIDLIAGLFLKIQQILRRLNKALLPEYSSLRKYLYGDLDIQVQKDLYAITDVNDLYPHVNTVIALVFNNNNFLIEESTSTASTYMKVEIDVEKFYLSDQPSYETKSSLLFQKTVQFINTLKETPLPNDYITRYPKELQLIQSCIISFVYDTTHNYIRVLEYFTKQVNKDGKTSVKDVFLYNVSKVVQYSYHHHSKRLESLNILKDENEVVFNLGKYITFEEFKIKLNNFDMDGMRTYSANVKKAMDDVKTLSGKLGQKEIQQVELNFSKSYSDFTSLYGMLSLLILMNVIHRVYYGVDISFSFVKAAV